MDETPSNYLVTYDPDYLEEHTESSAFEDSLTSIGQKHSNQFLLIRENFKHFTKKQKVIRNCKISNGVFRKTTKNGYNIHRMEEKEPQITRKFHRRKVDKLLARANEHRNLCKGDQSNYKQKKALMRHKVIPCLSSMLERSILKLTPKEIQTKNILRDNCCQVGYGNDERRKRTKFKKQKQIKVQHVYAVERITQDHTPHTINQNTQILHYDHNKSPKKVYSNIICNVALSEDESEELDKLTRKKIKKQQRFEMMKGNSKCRRALKNYEQQFPSKLDLYQVFTTNQLLYEEKIIPPRKGKKRFHSESSVTSSGFWDYLVDKINKKCFKKPKSVKQYLQKDFGVQCCPVSNENYGANKESKRPRKNLDTASDTDCPCSDLNLNHANIKRKDFVQNIDSSNIDLPAPMKSIQKKTTDEIVQCECPVEAQDHRQTMGINKPSPALIQKKTCRCQRSHDQMTKHLAKKYNGEVLCIHNPPCILINGCLNMAPPLEAAAVKARPVIEAKKESIFQRNKKSKNKKLKQEQFTQHHEQSFEVRQCNIQEYTNEKLIQSLCSHKPPCEVIRCCRKERYDPKLQNSCVHVPMCQRVPECVLQNIRENQPIGICNHKPKCAEVPLCTRKFVAVTTKVSLGTQVKPQMKKLCRHDPPCVLIPKCLGRSDHETYISYETAPNCMHQPLCDLIPACCRKSTKGMASACSQYPNGCRVV